MITMVVYQIPIYTSIFGLFHFEIEDFINVSIWNLVYFMGIAISKGNSSNR